MSTPYPWQKEAWIRLQQRNRNKNMPHALLLYGQPGLAKLQFAQCLAGGLLCHEPNEQGTSCGRCQGCGLFTAGSHPDFYTVATEEDSQQIKVDQIRALNEFMMLSPQYGRYKIGLIDQAEALNRNAANGLLKTLEEPPPGSLIMLVSSRPMHLPATIRSRCQRVVFSVPPRPQGMAWLREQLPEVEDSRLLLSLTQGEPLTAVKLVRSGQLETRQRVFTDLVQLLSGQLSAVTLATRWGETDLRQLVDWLMSWLVDMVRLQFNVDTICLDNQDFYQDLDGLSKRVDLRCLFRLLDEMLEYKRLSDAPLNHQLLLEDLWLAWFITWHRSYGGPYVGQ